MIIIACFGLCRFVPLAVADGKEKETTEMEKIEARLNRGELLTREELNLMSKHVRETTSEAVAAIPMCASAEQRAAMLKGIEKARREMTMKLAKAEDQRNEHELLNPVVPLNASPKERDWMLNHAPNYSKQLLDILKSDLPQAEKLKAVRKVNAELDKHYKEFMNSK